MIRPSRSEHATTLLPTKREIRAPQIRRERMSRPSSSVPHQCCTEGVCKRFGRSMCAGSCGAIHGAKIAAIANTATNTAPTAAKGLCRATRGSEMARVDMVLKFFSARYLAGKKKCLGIFALAAQFEGTEILIPRPRGDNRFSLQPNAEMVEIVEADVAVAHSLDQMVADG